MKEQIDFCEAVVADLTRLFPGWTPDLFATNAANCKLGALLTVTMPAEVARQLIDARGGR